MEVLQAICSRKSVRSYTGQPISKEDLDKILLAAQASPIARARYANMHMTLITSPELLAEIDKVAAEFMGDSSLHPLYGAPLLIVISAQIPESSSLNSMCSSAACMVENMAIEATALGVGTCHIWGAIGAMNAHPEVIAKLNLPEGFTPTCGITLGLTEEKYEPREIPVDRIKSNTIE